MDNKHNIEKRTATYSSKTMSRNIARGEKYEDIKQVIMVNILGYNIFKYEDYISNTVTVLEKHRECEVISLIKYCFIELPKFRKQHPDMNNKLNQWLAFLDDTDRGLVQMAEEKNKILQRARVEMNYLTGDAAVRRLAELREKWEMDRISDLNYAEKKGEKRGEKRGRELGQREEKIEIAKKLINKNVEINEIIEITGLSKEEIEKLQ